MPNVEYKELGWTDMVNIKLTENEENLEHYFFSLLGGKKDE